MKGSFLLPLAIVASIASAQTPAQFSGNAKKAADSLAEIIVVRENQKQPGMFAALKIRASNVRWDVKKTDSLLAPVQAYVFANTDVSGTKLYPDAEQAKSAEFTPLLSGKMEITYIPSANGWTFSSGRQYEKTLGKWFDIKPPKAGALSPEWIIVESFEVQ